MRGKRKVNKDVLAKSQYMKFFPFVLVITVIGFMHVFNYFFNTYNPYIMIENEGFMLGNNQLANILNKEDITNFDNNLNTVDMHEANYVYKMALNKYTNEDKKPVDISYPMFINDGLSIVNYNENTNLINTNLRRTLGSANQVFSYGRAYELNNYEPIDNVSYILLNYSNGIYINLYDLKIKTNANEYDIPVNSFIYFFDNQINYYERNNDIFTKKQIVDIDYSSTLSFHYDSVNQNYSYNYEEFLIGLGKLFKEEVVVPPKKIIEEKDQIEEVEEVVEPIIPTPKPHESDWVKPVVTSTELTTGVYSAKGIITINDPAGVIVKAPSFTFINNGKTYSRKSFYTSGEFTISGLKPESTFDVVGQYTYLDEDLKTRKIVTFFADTITTGNMDKLDPIELSFNLGEIYSRKIELNDLKITSNINSEVLKGVRSIAFSIDGEDYYLSTADTSSLLNGKTLSTVSTSDSLSSNREYNFEISFYDTIGRKLKVLNGKNSTRTSKKAPSVVLKVVQNEVDYLILGIDLKNDDNVNISNYRYIVTNTSGKVIEQKLIDGNRIRLDNLDPNQIFTIKVFGDYDLNDGKGLNKDVELTSIDFTSLPITSLGFLNLNFDINDIDSDSISLKYKINSNKTDDRLIKLVKEINFELFDITNNRVVRTFSISTNDLESLKNLSELNMNLDGLVSNTKYTLNINTVVKQGETSYNLECLHNLDHFETHKKKPVIDMTSSFVTNDMIDFDVRVVDTDNAILSSRVRVELRDSSNKLITSKLIEINDEYERITYKYLNTNTTYYIIFIADEYNETNNNSTYKSRYELSRVEKFTEDGISGKIELNSAVRVANGENLVDVNSDTKWIQTTRYYTIPKTVDNEGNIHIYAQRDVAAYTYDLTPYHGEYVTATFKIKAVKKFNERVYFGNYVTGSTNTRYSMQLENIKTDEWTAITFSFVVGYYKYENDYFQYNDKYFGKNYMDFVGFYINNVGTDKAEYVIKDFEIHVAKDRQPMEIENFETESGGWGSTGNKSSWGNRRTRPKDAIILDGGHYYEFYFSDDPNYQAHIYFTDMDNHYISQRDQFVSGTVVYVPENSKIYIAFRYCQGNADIFPGDIKFLRVTKYADRELTGNKTYTYDFISTARVNLNDLHNEITNDTYYVRVSDKNNHELYVKEYKELVDTNTIVDALKELNLDENREYRVSLFIRVRDREYELDYFYISTNHETVGITNTNDWTYMQPYGNYIVLNDIDFKGYTNQSLGWGYKYFYGQLDFQGYKAILYSKDNYSRIGTMAKSSVIKNLVLDVHLDNIVNNNDIRGFVSSNSGTIENVIINIYDERTKYFNDMYISTLTENNSVDGRIRNFVINLKTRVNIYWDSGLLVRTNYGLIENGYVYGENAFVTNERSGTSYRSVSLIQKYGGVKSILQNVFVLSSIEFPNNYPYDVTGLATYETYGIVRNVYTTGNVNTIKQEVGPIVGRLYATATLSNAYYLNDSIYTMPNQNKIPVSAISDLSFQKNVLKDGFNIDEMIELGYYPQVAFTYEKMPNQEYIELPKIEDKDLVDILNVNVVSQTNNTGIVELTIQNEFGDEITGVKISNLDSRIISQTFEDGKTYLKLEVSNPIVYVSKYEIRGITSRSYNNIQTERKYSPGDEYLYIEMYREINNISDWLKINSYLNQNFAIMTDLDFREYSNYYINNYSGTIKGNNHVLKNISIVSDKSGLFNQMNGTLKDIYFENIIKTSSSQYNGVVGYSNQYGRFDNVHVKNIEIIVPSSRAADWLYVGGLVGYAYYSKFTNCSVTNVTESVSSAISGIKVGGMAGYSVASTYNNVYVNNANIDVRNTISTAGIGGIVGQEDSSIGVIQNAYATGRIYNNGRYTGGITGYTLGYIENSYAMVDIVSEMKDTGGITGYSGTVDYISNNLFIGNISSKVSENFHRIIGSGVSKNTNYALSTGLINGVISNETNGEKLISMTDLLNKDNYNLGDAFDYSKVSEGIIPKVYYMDTKDLLPNQDDIYFEKDILEINDIIVDKHVDYSTIVMYLKNPNNYIIDDIVIENMDVIIRQKAHENGISIITIDATPLKYFDSYYFKEIKYHVDGENEELSCKKAVFLEMTFYKNLSTYDDWQSVSKIDAENYILTNDIDFTGKTFNRDVIFNRLETSGAETYTIKGMTINQTGGGGNINIIKKVMSSIKGITFKDITINNPNTTNNDYISLIGFAYGEIRDMNFDNIIVYAPNKNRVGIFGRVYTDSIDNIKMKDVTVTGRNYVAGLFAYYENKENSYISNVEAENINVTATTDYAGGIFTNIANGFNEIKNIYNFSIKDSTITAPNSAYVGGIGGKAYASDAIVDNVKVVGKEYVGAAFGYDADYHTYNVHVKNCTVEGSNRYIGGITGQVRVYMYDSIIENTSVTGTGVNTTAVGGVAGLLDYTHITRTSIKDSTINNNGDVTGGVVGLLANGTISIGSVDNVIVNGVNYVGGIVGRMTKGTISSDRVTNSTINAQGNYAGGIVGHDDNSVSGTTFNEGALRDTMVLNSTITSNSYAGGFAGKLNEELYNIHSNYGLYTDSSISTNDNETAYLGVGGNYNSQIVNLGRTGFYRNTLINGTPIKDSVSNTLDTRNLITNLYSGFINSSTGNVETNYNYPNGTYTDLILLKAGKTYLLKAVNADKTNADIFRGRIYDTSYNYLNEVAWNNQTMNYLGRYYGLGNNHEVYFMPIRDVYVRITFLYEITEASLVEVKSTYANILINRLFDEGQLRSRLLWNKYISDSLSNEFIATNFYYDQATWDFSPLKNEKSNVVIPDKSGNNHSAVANYTSLLNNGILMGSSKDRVTISNYTPESDITISAKFASYVNKSSQYVFSYRDPSNNNGVGLYIGYRTICVTINGTNYSAAYTLPLYKEATVTVTYENSKTLKVYVNGELIFTKTNINKTIKTSANAKIYIADDATYTGSYKFVGTVGYIHLYNRALNATEIANNYRQSSGVTDTTGLQLSYDFRELEYDDVGYYPELKASPEQAHVPIPVRANNIVNQLTGSPRLTGSAFSPIYNEKLEGNYHIYSSGIDTINLEFDKISNDLSFTYKVGEEEITVNNVNQRVYTLHYDYNSDASITIRNAFEGKVVNLNRNNLAKTIGIYKNSYYYIKENELFNGDEPIMDNALHIYKNLVLLSDNSIYNLETGNTQTQIQNNNLIVSTIPLYQATIEGSIVDTYYNFTEITDINGEVTIKDNQIIYKDGQLYVINSSDKDNSSVIVNNYNNNEYQIILGKDNELYSYKTSLVLNSAFINANIKEITSDFDSSLPLIMVRYNNDEILVLNYYNGSKIYQTGDNQNISLTSFIGLSFKNNDLSHNNSTYSDNSNLTDSLNNLNDKEINKILDSITSSNSNNNNNSKTEPIDESAIINNNTVNTRYIISYNEYKNEYEVYDVGDVLFNSSPVTVNSKINSNKALYNYFYNNTKINDILKDNRIIIYIAIITLIVVNLVYLVNKSRRKEVVHE